jgi:hypothetical protein
LRLGESYSDVILRLVEIEAQGDSKPLLEWRTHAL